MVDINSGNSSLFVLRHEVQIPLWSILTVNKFACFKVTKQVQIPLWSILTVLVYFVIADYLSSDSSMVDINK